MTGSFEVDGIDAEVVVAQLETGPGKLTFTFPDGITGVQTITYRTEPTDPTFAATTTGQTIFENKATVKLNDVTKNTAPASVTLNWIEKNGQVNNEAKTITWTVTVNKPDSNGVTYTLPNAWLIDTLPGGLTLESVSVKIGDDPVQLLDLDDYPLEGRVFKYSFGNLDETAVLTFVTSVDSDGDYNSNDQTPFKNDAKLIWGGNETGPSDSSTEGVGTSVIAKKGESGEYDNNDGNALINWTVTINDNRVPLENLTIKDTIPAGLSLVPGSVKLTVNDVVDILEPEEYSYEPGTEGVENILTYVYSGSLNTRAYLEYQTKIDPEYFPELYTNKEFVNDESVQIKNKVTLSGTGLDGDEQATGIQTYDSQMIHKSVGKYDYTTKQMTWTVVINRNKMTLTGRAPLTGAVITDIIPEGLKLVEGSVKLKIGEIEDTLKEGDYGYTPSKINAPGSLTYTFNGPLSDMATLTFTTEVLEEYLETRFPGDKAEKAIENTASLDAEEMAEPLFSSARVTVKNPITEKLAVYDSASGADFVKWKVPINMAGITMADGFTLTDSLDPKLILNEATVRLYEMVLDEDGNVAHTTPDPTVVPDSEYTFSYEGNLFTFTFSESTSKVYQLEFITDLDIEPGKNLTINNQITLSGSLPPTTVESGQKTFKISAGGFLQGSSAKIIVKKTDESGNPLAGAKFRLADKFDDNIQTLTTDDSGEITFTGLRFKTFYVREIISPDDYLAEKDNQQMVQLTTEDNTATMTFKNKPALGSITFLKHNDKERPLAGAKFSLYRHEPGNTPETPELVFVATETSGANGRVTFTDLPLGTYTVQETKAPSGYRIPKDAQPVVVTLTKSDDHTEVVASLDPDTVFINDRAPSYPDPLGGIEIKKTDGEGKALAGAEFTLYDASGKVVEIAVSGSDGKVVFTDLPYGSYTVKETGVPEGYKGSDAVISVNVQRSTAPYEYTVENLLLEEPEDPDVPGGGEDPDDPDGPEDPTEDLDDPNAPGGDAKPDPDNSPKTGSPSFYPLWLLLLSSLTGIATVLRYPKKRRTH